MRTNYQGVLDRLETLRQEAKSCGARTIHLDADLFDAFEKGLFRMERYLRDSDSVPQACAYCGRARMHHADQCLSCGASRWCDPKQAPKGLMYRDVRVVRRQT